MLRQRIAGIAGLVLGTLIAIQAALNYLANESLCLHSLCIIPLIYMIQNDEYLAFGLIIVGVSAGLLVVNERRERRRSRSQLLKTKSRQRGVG